MLIGSSSSRAKFGRQGKAETKDILKISFSNFNFLLSPIHI